MQFTFYNKFIEKLFLGEVNLNTATIKVALVHDPANSGFSDISQQEDAANLGEFTGGMGGATGFTGVHEFDAMDYARGTLAGQSVTRDNGADHVRLTATNQDFGTLSNDGMGHGVGGVLLILHADGSDANDVPICLMPWTKTPDGSNFTVPWSSSNGVFYLDGPPDVTFYNVFMEKLFTGGINLSTQSIKVALVNKASSTGNTNLATLEDVDNLAGFSGGGFSAGGHEFNGAGYVRGTLATQAVTRNTTTNRALLDGDDQDFGNVTNNVHGVGQVMLLANVDGNEANDFPIMIMTYEQVPDGTNYTIPWQSIGLFFCSQA